MHRQVKPENHSDSAAFLATQTPAQVLARQTLANQPPLPPPAAGRDSVMELTLSGIDYGMGELGEAAEKAAKALKITPSVAKGVGRLLSVPASFAVAASREGVARGAAQTARDLAIGLTPVAPVQGVVAVANMIALGEERMTKFRESEVDLSDPSRTFLTRHDENVLTAEGVSRVARITSRVATQILDFGARGIYETGAVVERTGVPGVEDLGRGIRQTGELLHSEPEYFRGPEPQETANPVVFNPMTMPRFIPGDHPSSADELKAMISEGTVPQDPSFQYEPSGDFIVPPDFSLPDQPNRRALVFSAPLPEDSSGSLADLASISVGGGGGALLAAKIGAVSIKAGASIHGVGITASVPVSAITAPAVGCVAAGLVVAGGAEAGVRKLAHPYNPEASELENATARVQRREGTVLAKGVGDGIRWLNKRFLNPEQMTRKEALSAQREAANRAAVPEASAVAAPETRAIVAVPNVRVRAEVLAPAAMPALQAPLMPLRPEINLPNLPSHGMMVNSSVEVENVLYGLEGAMVAASMLGSAEGMGRFVKSTIEENLPDNRGDGVVYVGSVVGMGTGAVTGAVIGGGTAGLAGVGVGAAVGSACIALGPIGWAIAGIALLAGGAIGGSSGAIAGGIAGGHAGEAIGASLGEVGRWIGSGIASVFADNVPAVAPEARPVVIPEEERPAAAP